MKTLQRIVSLRLAVAAMSMALSLPAQDEAEALLRETDWNPTELVEQLKAAKALMTAEVWIPSTDKRRVGAKVRDPEAEAKVHAKGILELDAVAKLKGLPSNVRIELYQLRMLQYSKIQPDTIKYEKYVSRLLEIPDCPQDIRSEVEARQADLGSPWQVMRSYYVECLPEKVIEGRKKVYEAHTLKKIASTDFSKRPEIAEDYNGLGRMYWTDGENEKAEPLFRAVMDQKDVQGSQVAPGRIGDAMMFLASIELRRGNRDKALQYCKDLNAKAYPNIDNSRRYYPAPGLHAAKAVRHWLDDYTSALDNLKLPTFTDCRPYPSPQEPKYTDQFVALKSVRFEGGADFPKDHPVFRLIGVKFKRYGIAVSDDAPFTIRVQTSRHADTPDKPEGYYLQIGDKEAVISGNDYRGTVWGVVSFIQCVDGSNKKVRVCQVRDWPLTPLRGHSGYGDDLIEFGLFNKLNFFFNQTYCFTDTGLPDLEVRYENLKYMAKPFADFGLEFYVADRTSMFPKLSLTSDRTFQYHLRRHSRLASYGAGISMILDDSRYPLNEIDAKVEGGKGWRIDNQYVQKLYTAVKEKHPDVKMVFCPTYYWGPHWKNEQYTDTRQEYFQGIRTYLDPAIKVFWSGNQVKGYHKSKKQVQWFVDSAGRKPMVWQNAMGQHWAMGYGCEVINFTGWHYPGFFANDCAGYMANATFPSRAFELAHMADALWNPDRYRASEENRENSLERATDQLCGKGVYELLRPGTRVLGYMDRYLWSNGMVLNQHLHEESRDEIEEMFEKADGGLKRALAIHPSAQTYSGHYYVPLSTMKQLLEQFDNPKSFYELPEYRPGQSANLKFAQKEAKLDIVEDLFANAFDFHTGKPMIAEGRLCTQYYPKSPSRKGEWTFSIDEDAIGEYELNICGRLAQEGEAKPTIRVTLNKSELYKGPAPFKHDSWSFMTRALDWETIQEDNKLTIENISPREKWSKPLTYYLNYAIVRLKKEEGKEAEDNGLLDDLLE
jgi:hypothetical protein